jgi:hypothetical protein
MISQLPVVKAQIAHGTTANSAKPDVVSNQGRDFGYWIVLGSFGSKSHDILLSLSMAEAMVVNNRKKADAD